MKRSHHRKFLAALSSFAAVVTVLGFTSPRSSNLLSCRTGKRFREISFSDTVPEKETFWEDKDKLIYNEVALKEKFTDLSKMAEEDVEAVEEFQYSVPPPQQFVNAVSTAGQRDAVSVDGEGMTSDNKRKEKQKKVLPFFDVDSIGLEGRWISKGGNYILLPIDENGVESRQPLGVIHFLGSAFFGAAPQLSYRYLLEALNKAGYIIVATPYRLQFDHLKMCDDVLTKFDVVAVELAKEYGALPVIGLGHSCGALLQTLITSLFPDAPRAINVLISFNNRPAVRSIPAFEELVVPISEQVMGESDRSKRLRSTIGGLRKAFDKAVDTFTASQLAPAFVGDEVVPLIRQTVEIADQIPPILQMIAQGRREFNPEPADTREVCRRMYRARRTLLIKFENDDLDESDDIENVLREANSIMRMKRPMVEMDVQLKVMRGRHITPLTQNILLSAPKNIPIIQPLVDFNDRLIDPVREQLKKNFLKTINEVRDEILTFLDESIVRGP